MNRTDYFSCDRRRIQCWVDSEARQPDAASLIIHHCPESRDIPIIGKITKFQERRGGVWVEVQRWIDAA